MKQFRIKKISIKYSEKYTDVYFHVQERFLFFFWRTVKDSDEDHKIFRNLEGAEFYIEAVKNRRNAKILKEEIIVKEL